MKRYLLERILGLGLVLFGISLLVFAMIALLPGDPATAILGPYATPERAAELSRELGLQEGPVKRYLSWLGNLLSGDFGHSYSFERPVVDLLGERLGPTLALALAALGFGTLLGLLLGSVAAVRRGITDRVLSSLTLVGISTPSFWLAMLLMLVFAVDARWFPASGMVSPSGAGAGGLIDVCHHLVLPACALGLVVAGVIARLMRTAMLETLGLDFVRMAKAKGLAHGQVVYGHAFFVAFTRVIPVIGLQAGFVLGGAVYIETVFQWPGLGKLLVDAILQRDYLLAQGAVLVVATCYVFINLGTDLLQRALDPRLRS